MHLKCLFFFVFRIQKRPQNCGIVTRRVTTASTALPILQLAWKSPNIIGKPQFNEFFVAKKVFHKLLNVILYLGNCFGGMKNPQKIENLLVWYMLFCNGQQLNIHYIMKLGSTRFAGTS